MSAFFAMGLLGLLLKRESVRSQERTTFLIGAGCGHNRDIKATRGVDLVVLEFGEDQLVVDPEGVVAISVERLRR